MVKELRDVGVSLQFLRKVVEYLRKVKKFGRPTGRSPACGEQSDVLLVQGREGLINVQRLWAGSAAYCARLAKGGGGVAGKR